MANSPGSTYYQPAPLSLTHSPLSISSFTFFFTFCIPTRPTCCFHSSCSF